MTCNRTDELFGARGHALDAALELHAQTCVDCGPALEALRHTSTVLGAHHPARPSGAARARAWAVIEAARAPEPSAWTWMGRPAITAAAVAAIAVILAFSVRRDELTSRPDPRGVATLVGPGAARSTVARGRVVEARAGAHLTVAEARVELSSDARFVIDDSTLDATALRFEGDVTDVRVEGAATSAIVLVTPETRVRVLGARVALSRTPAGTTMRVLEGEVVAWPRGRPLPVTLVAGERIELPSHAPEAASVGATGPEDHTASAAHGAVAVTGDLSHGTGAPEGIEGILSPGTGAGERSVDLSGGTGAARSAATDLSHRTGGPRASDERAAAQALELSAESKGGTRATSGTSATRATADTSATRAATDASATRAAADPSATRAATDASATRATADPSATRAAADTSATRAATDASATRAAADPSATRAAADPKPTSDASRSGAESARGDAPRAEPSEGRASSDETQLGDAESLAARAGAERRSGDLARAVELYAELARHPDGGPYREQALLERALILTQLGRRDEALAALDQAHAQHAEGATAPERAALSAQLFLAASAPARAATMIERVEHVGRSPRLLVARVEVAEDLASDDPARARRLLAPVLDGDGPKALVLRALTIAVHTSSALGDRIGAETYRKRRDALAQR